MAKRGRSTRKRSPLATCLAILILGVIIVVVLAIPSSPRSTRTTSPTRAQTSQPTSRPDVQTVPSATITDTPEVAGTSAPQVAATNTLLAAQANQMIAITAMPNVPLFYVLRTANARRCPETACEIVTVLEAGETFGAYGLAFGEMVGTSNQWYQTKLLLDQQIAYVHSSLVIEESLVSQPVQAQVQQPLDAPVQQSSGGVSCGGASTCGEMVSCEQARACLAAGNGRLDRDSDGVPCEDICTGG